MGLIETAVHAQEALLGKIVKVVCTYMYVLVLKKIVVIVLYIMHL